MRRPMLVVPLGFLTCSFFLPPTPARAAHPLITDDAGTLGLAAAEVEVSSTLGRSDGLRSPSHVALGLALHVGVLDELDLGAGVIVESHVGRDATDARTHVALAVDGKWRWLEPDGAAPGLALRLEYAPPVTGGEGHDASGLLLASWEPAARLEAHLDVGLTAMDLGTAAPAPTWVATAAVVGHLLGGLALGAEAGIELELEGPVAGWMGTLGVAWSPVDGPRVSVGLGPVWTADEGLGWVATLALTAGVGPG